MFESKKVLGMSRRGVAAIYIGDIGEIVIQPPVKPLTEKVDTDALTTRQMFQIALDHGVDVRYLLGVADCEDHDGMVYVGGNKLPDGYNWCDNMRYCNNCWRWFRDK